MPKGTGRKSKLGPIKNERYLLYIDILGFSDLVAKGSQQIHDLYEIIASLNVHRHQSFKTIVFSDTILVYNVSAPQTAHDRRYLIMFLCEFAQDLQHRLTGRDIFFRAVLVRGEFIHYELNEVPCFFGTSLIMAYQSEKQIEAIGLFIDKSLLSECKIFSTRPFNETYSFVFITQALDQVEDFYGGAFPMHRDIVEGSDLIYNLVPEVLYLKRLSYWATAHKSDKVRQKHATTLAIFRSRYPNTVDALDGAAFDLRAISPKARWSKVVSRYPESYSWAVKKRVVF